MSDAVERLDERGRVTVKAPFRHHLKDGYIQILTPDGVLFHALRHKKIRSTAPALDNVDDEAMKDL